MTSLGAKVTGVDFSETMLAVAWLKLKDQNWCGTLADAEALHPFADASFDFAIARHLAWTLTDPVAAYREWHRVLKPGGKLLIVDGNWMAPKSTALRLRQWLADRLGARMQRTEEERALHTHIMERLPYGTGLTAELLIADLEKAGFSTFRALTVSRAHGAGMRGHSLADRLCQTAANRFALVAS